MSDNEGPNLIEEAFNEALRKTEFLSEGDFLGDWLIIGHVSNPDSDIHGYPMLFSNGSVAGHVARGLLQTGLSMMGVDE